MDSNNLVSITTNLYNLTLLFPKKDPLRFKMRELGNDILANANLIFKGKFEKSEDLILEIQRDLEVLNCFFEVVKNLNWVSIPQLLDVREEYIKIEEEIRKISVEKERQLKLNSIEKPKTSLPEIKKDSDSSIIIGDSNLENSEQKKSRSSRTPFLDRKNKILEVLRERGKLQVGDMKEFFPDVSKRTLRRDFRYLVNTEKIERMGEKNETFYQVR